VIERIGMDRTRRALEQSDLALVVLDGSRQLDAEDVALINDVRTTAQAMWMVVVTKSDLPRVLNERTLREVAGLGVEIVSASAVVEGGTDELEEALAALVLSGRAVPRPGDATVTSVRHRDALRRAEEHVAAAIESARDSRPAAFIAVDLHSALNALGEIIGETVGEDLLDEIFRNFCIGK
jgi:tRNA modification GTPase